MMLYYFFSFDTLELDDIFPGNDSQLAVRQLPDLRIFPATCCKKEGTIRRVTMNDDRSLVAFERYKIRRFFNEDEEIWYFSVIDVVGALTDSVNPRDYWFKMKTRVKTEADFELSTICRRLKMKAPDGKMRQTDCADVQGLLRIIQSIPSPKAEPFKQWLARVGYERIQDMSDPARSLDRAREYWQQHGRSEKWIQQRMCLVQSSEGMTISSGLIQTILPFFSTTIGKPSFL